MTGQAVRAVASACRVLAVSARMQVLMIRGHPMIPLATIVQPAVFCVIVLGADGPAGRARASSTIFAVMLTCLWGATLWAAGGILRREIADGTLAKCLTSVHDARLIVIGKCLGSTLLAVTLLLGTAVTAGLLLGAPLRLADVAWLIAGLLLATASATALGFLLSGIFVLTPHATHLTSALMYPVFILGGLLIPARLLPWPLARVSGLISLYWTRQFLAGAIAGRPDSVALLYLAGLTCGYFLAGWLLFTRLVDRARRAGTVDLG